MTAPPPVAGLWLALRGPYVCTGCGQILRFGAWTDGTDHWCGRCRGFAAWIDR